MWFFIFMVNNYYYNFCVRLLVCVSVCDIWRGKYNNNNYDEDTHNKKKTEIFAQFSLGYWGVCCFHFTKFTWDTETVWEREKSSLFVELPARRAHQTLQSDERTNEREKKPKKKKTAMNEPKKNDTITKRPHSPKLVNEYESRKTKKRIENYLHLFQKCVCLCEGFFSVFYFLSPFFRTPWYHSKHCRSKTFFGK